MKTILGIGFLLLGIGVVLGAFGAHGLKEFFIGREEEIWKTAVFYHLLHAIGILIVVTLGQLSLLPTKVCRASGYGLLAGISIFSGSLYLLVLTRVKWLGAITPIGGTILIGTRLVLAYLCLLRGSVTKVNG